MGKIVNFKKLYNCYPLHSQKSTKALFKEKFGGTELENSEDSCALRISIAFNEAGMPIERIGSVNGGYYDGNDGKIYVLRAAGIKDYLRRKYGPPTIKTLKKTIMDDRPSVAAKNIWERLLATNGVMVITRNDSKGTGHADIWHRGDFLGGNALRESWAHEIFLWEGI